MVADNPGAIPWLYESVRRNTFSRTIDLLNENPLSETEGSRKLRCWNHQLLDELAIPAHNHKLVALASFLHDHFKQAESYADEFCYRVVPGLVASPMTPTQALQDMSIMCADRLDKKFFEALLQMFDSRRAKPERAS